METTIETTTNPFANLIIEYSYVGCWNFKVMDNNITDSNEKNPVHNKPHDNAITNHKSNNRSIGK